MADFPPVEESLMPLGLAMSLSNDTDAIKAFSSLTPGEQDEIMSRARQAQSRDDMNSIVRSLYGE